MSLNNGLHRHNWFNYMHVTLTYLHLEQTSRLVWEMHSPGSIRPRPEKASVMSCSSLTGLPLKLMHSFLVEAAGFTKILEATESSIFTL